MAAARRGCQCLASREHCDRGTPRPYDHPALLESAWMDSPLPEFRVPLSRVQPGMVLARNIEQSGVLLLRHGMELDDELIARLHEHGVRSLYVNFTDADVETYKRLLIGEDSPPTYERLVDLTREVFIELIP